MHEGQRSCLSAGPWGTAELYPGAVLSPAPSSDEN